MPSLVFAGGEGAMGLGTAVGAACADGARLVTVGSAFAGVAIAAIFLATLGGARPR